jgi:two-component system sensor histidine kinase BaeS
MQHINTLAETLKTQEKSKNQWLADISHELRTPLTILAGEIELVKAGIRAFDNKQLISFDQEVSRLSLLVDDLYQLSLSDIGGLRYQFSPLSLSDIVDEQCDKLRARFQQKLLSLHVCATQNAVINADASRIKQLLSNLLINACEYTDAPGEVHISVTTSQTTVTLCVEDSAPGVIKGNESMLFEPLFREDASRARRSSGGGLGLSICKQIAQAHKGEISAMPSMLGGVKINVTFPAITEQKDQ